MNATQEYSAIFGPGSHKDPKNIDHFRCVETFTEGLVGVTTIALERLDVAIGMRTSDKSNDRNKRSPAVPIAMAISSLAATGKLSRKFYKKPS